MSWTAAMVLLALISGCNSRALGEPRPLPSSVEERRSEDLPDNRIRVWSTSASVQRATPYRISVYTHCGLDYMFDFDGSFWEVQAGPEDPHTYLDNLQDEGVVTLESEDVAVYVSSEGGVFRLARTHGPREVNVCE